MVIHTDMHACDDYYHNEFHHMYSYSTYALYE